MLMNWECVILQFFPVVLATAYQFITAADVCVVPNHYEPFGLVAIEAMASGTPVVASDVAVQFTVVPEETGPLAPPKDNAGLRRQLIEFSDHLCKTTSQAARKRVKLSLAGTVLLPKVNFIPSC